MDQTIKSVLDAWGHVFPELALVAAACVQFLLAPFLSGTPGPLAAGMRHRYAALSLLALGFAIWFWFGSASAALPGSAAMAIPSSLLSGPFRLDGLTWFVRGFTLISGVVLVLLCWNQFAEDESGECHACLLLILAGVNLVAAANDLVVLFLALELVSIPTYVLLYLLRRDLAGHEAVLKYFLLSVFSSALLMYGFSLLYGATGTTNLESVRVGLGSPSAAALPLLTAVALVAVIAGVGFRVTAVPFHFYAPDVFQGTHAVGAALLSIVPKLAGFTVLLRLLGVLPLAAAVAPQVAALPDVLAPILWWLAVLTMCVGNVLALLQKNVQRLLAYSSIAHGGYMLVGLALGPGSGSVAHGIPALLFYLVVYGFMTVGAFSILIAVGGRQRRSKRWTIWWGSGVGDRRPPCCWPCSCSA